MKPNDLRGRKATFAAAPGEETTMSIGKIRKLVHSPQHAQATANPANDFRPAARYGADELLNLSKPLTLTTIGGYEALLKSKGWSPGAVACIRNGKTFYVVACNRGEELIVGKGENQRAAWKHVVEKAE
jgi:hypothetical protein